MDMPTRQGVSHTSLAERASGAWEAVWSSFGFLPGLAMVTGVLLGFGVPSIDAALNVDLPVFDFTGQDAARSLLEIVATATVSVAGLSFSVILVAFTLASSQLSPRVLRTFRSDRLIQATLAVFLGTFVYCLAVLVRLESTGDGQPVPNLSVTLAIVLAFAAFVTFAAFIAHIVRMLQPSSLVEGIRASAWAAVASPFPAGIGQDPDDDAAASAALSARRATTPVAEVMSDAAGYVTTVLGAQIVELAAAHDAVVVQRAALGDYAVPGTVLAEVWCRDAEDLVDQIRAGFDLGPQRTPVQDVAFPVRQLADVALKGLSPGINDPTTAENAMGAATALLVRAAHGGRSSALRCDGEGVVRMVVRAPSLDDLVRLAFEQVRVYAASDPVVSRALLRMLAHVDDAAREAGVPCAEAARQAALLAEGQDAGAPTARDAESVRAAHAALWPRDGQTPARSRG